MALSMVWIHAAAAVLRLFAADHSSPEAVPLAVASAAVGGVAGLVGTRLARFHAAIVGVVAGASALGALAALGAVHWVTGIALPLVGAACGALG